MARAERRAIAAFLRRMDALTLLVRRAAEIREHSAEAVAPLFERAAAKER